MKTPDREISCLNLDLDDGQVVTVRVTPTTRVAELEAMVMNALGLGDDKRVSLSVPQAFVQRIDGSDIEFLLDGEETPCFFGDFDLYITQEYMASDNLVSTYLKSSSRHPQAIHVFVDVFAAEETAAARTEQMEQDDSSADDDDSTDNNNADPAPSTPAQASRPCERSCLSFQDVTIEHRKQLLKALGLGVRVERVNTHSTPAPFPVSALDMSKRAASTSEQEYVRAYLKGTIGATAQRKRVRLELVSDIPDLLSVEDARLPFDLSGSADAVVVQDLQASTRRCLHHLQGLRLVIDVKRNVDDAYALFEAQAIAKLIAANARCPDALVAVLMTNLNDVWMLLWLSPDRLVKIAPMTSASDGMRAIGCWLTKRADKTNFHVPYVANCTRATLSSLLPPLKTRNKSNKRASESTLDDDSDVPARVVKAARTIVDPYSL